LQSSLSKKLYVQEQAENKNVSSERLKESLLMAGSLRLSGKFHIAEPATEKARRP